MCQPTFELYQKGGDNQNGQAATVCNRLYTQLKELVHVACLPLLLLSSLLHKMCNRSGELFYQEAIFGIWDGQIIFVFVEIESACESIGPRKCGELFYQNAAVGIWDEQISPHSIPMMIPFLSRCGHFIFEMELYLLS